MAEISSIQSVDLKSIRIPSRRGQLLTKLAALEVGQGFEITGMEQSRVCNRASSYGKSANRSFATKSLGVGKTLVYRYA